MKWFFEPPHGGDGSVAEPGSGPGRDEGDGGPGLIGLPAAVLQRHGAQLAIESQEGRGSTFTCHFPRERVQNVLALAAAN